MQVQQVPGAGASGAGEGAGAPSAHLLVLSLHQLDVLGELDDSLTVGLTHSKLGQLELNIEVSRLYRTLKPNCAMTPSWISVQRGKTTCWYLAMGGKWRQ